MGLDNRFSAPYNTAIREDGNKYARPLVSENRRSVQGGSERQAEYIPEHDPQRPPCGSVGGRRYAGYSVQPVSAGG